MVSIIIFCVKLLLIQKYKIKLVDKIIPIPTHYYTFIHCLEHIDFTNVSSAASRLGSPNEYIDYACSKGAIDTLTRGLSLELADEGILVNCVRPGFIHTDIHKLSGDPNRIEKLKDKIPLKRGGMPDEVSSAIIWLLSEGSSYTTGSFIDIAGGK